MTDEKIIEYVMNSPENTNPSILSSMLKSKGTGIKTVVIKVVKDETTSKMVYTPNMTYEEVRETSKMVYTPNMTYEEVRDMMLNLEPFNVILIGAAGIDGGLVYSWSYPRNAMYDSKYNCIELIVVVGSSTEHYLWTAAGIKPAVE